MSGKVVARDSLLVFVNKKEITMILSGKGVTRTDTLSILLRRTGHMIEAHSNFHSYALNLQ